MEFEIQNKKLKEVCEDEIKDVIAEINELKGENGLKGIETEITTNESQQVEVSRHIELDQENQQDSELETMAKKSLEKHEQELEDLKTKRAELDQKKEGKESEIRAAQSKIRDVIKAAREKIAKGEQEEYKKILRKNVTINEEEANRIRIESCRGCVDKHVDELKKQLNRKQQELDEEQHKDQEQQDQSLISELSTEIAEKQKEIDENNVILQVYDEQMKAKMALLKQLWRENQAIYGRRTEWQMAGKVLEEDVIPELESNLKFKVDEKTQPAPAGPAPTGPAPAGPAPADPAPAGPAPAGPAPAGPAPADPAPADPAPTGPEPADSAPAGPAPADSAQADSAGPDPEKIEITSIEVDMKNGIYTFNVKDGEPIIININDKDTKKNEAYGLGLSGENLENHQNNGGSKTFDTDCKKILEESKWDIADYVVGTVLRYCDTGNGNSNLKRYVKFLAKSEEATVTDEMIPIIYYVDGVKKNANKHIQQIVDAAKKQGRTSMVKGAQQELASSKKKGQKLAEKEEKTSDSTESIEEINVDELKEEIDNMTSNDDKMKRLYELYRKPENRPLVKKVIDELGLNVQWLAYNPETPKKEKKGLKGLFGKRR